MARRPPGPHQRPKAEGGTLFFGSESSFFSPCMSLISNNIVQLWSFSNSDTNSSVMQKKSQGCHRKGETTNRCVGLDGTPAAGKPYLLDAFRWNQTMTQTHQTVPLQIKFSWIIAQIGELPFPRKLFVNWGKFFVSENLLIFFWIYSTINSYKKTLFQKARMGKFWKNYDLWQNIEMTTRNIIFNGNTQLKKSNQ